MRSRTVEPARSRTVVTGAAGGIGEATARLAAERGYAVVLADIDAHAIERLAIEIAAAGGEATAVPVDVRDQGSVEAMVQRAVERYDGFDSLINCAGGFRRSVRVEELSDEEWAEVLDLNLTGTFRCCRAAVPTLRRSAAAAIVNLTSEAGRSPGWITGAHYVAAKAGVIGLTKHLARELGEDGIRVNAVAPGTTLTPRVRELWDADRVEALASQAPLRRLATAEDQAGPVLWLTTPDSEYMTGATLDVNGGRLMI